MSLVRSGTRSGADSADFGIHHHPARSLRKTFGRNGRQYQVYRRTNGEKRKPKIKCTTVHTRAHDRVHTVDSLCVSSLQLFLPSGKVVAVRRAVNSENSLPSPLRVQAGWITLAPDVIAVPPLGRSEVKCRPPFPRGHTHTYIELKPGKANSRPAPNRTEPGSI